MAYDFPASPLTGQVFQGWTYDGEKWVSTLATPNQSGVIAIKVFTSGGLYVPSPSMTTCVIECVGGGGSGGGAAGVAGQVYAAGGGGSGGYSRKLALAADIGASQTVTIGAGGAATAAGGNAGNTGTDTSVGILCVAKGGSGGIQGTNAIFGRGGTGGIAGTGDVTAVGAVGGNGLYNGVNTTIAVPSGNGGSSMFGGGAVGVASGTTGIAATGYGGGGSGGYATGATTAAGGAGASGLVVITEYGMTALASTAGQGNVRYDLPQGLSANQMAQARSNTGVTKRNYIINGAFQINQGAYVTATALAAAAYGHDQWKAGAAGGDYSFTQSTSSTTVTIAAGKSLIQPIEDVRVTGGGNYVLAWTGTAQARAGVNTLTPAGAYAASPLLITGQTDGTVMSVEFNTGTLGNVSLTEGSAAPPFQVPDYASELASCKRYWQKITNSGYNSAAGVVINPVCFSEMRAAPTTTNISPGTVTTATFTLVNIASNIGGYFQINVTTAGGSILNRIDALNARL